MSALLISTAVQASDCIVGYWFGSPKIEKQTDMTGFRFGLPGSSGGPVHLNGMEMSIFCSSTERIEGFQFTWCGPALAGDLSGLQLSLYNRVRNEANGVQLGVINGSYNEADLQIGVINYAKKSAAFQLGAINYNPHGILPVSILFNFGSCSEAN